MGAPYVRKSEINKTDQATGLVFIVLDAWNLLQETIFLWTI